MSTFKAHLYQMSAYKPPLEGRDPAEHILLDFNERTLPVSEPICKALIEFINAGRIQMYPSYGDIVEQLAAYANVPHDRVMITNGSDQGIELVFRAACSAGDEVIIPTPTFAMYQQCAKIENAKIIEPCYSQDSGFPVDEVIASVTEKTRVICIANPNNPSGTITSKEDIARIAEAAPNSTILVDECYFEYAKLSVADLIDDHSNIIITRTFSKTWGIPSLRFGYMIGSAENILALLNVRGPYDINQLAVVAAVAALKHPDYTKEYVREVMEQSKPLFEEYLRRKGIGFWPSSANFLWVFVDDAEKLEAGLAQRGILVRPKKDASGGVGLRITLGALDQTKQLISTLDELL